MNTYYENRYSNVYPDYDPTGSNPMLDYENIVTDIIKLGYGYYAVQYASGKRERVTEDMAREIAHEMDYVIADRVN